MNKQLRQIRTGIKTRGFCNAYVVAGGTVYRMKVTELTDGTITGFDFKTQKEQAILLAEVTEITIL